MASGNIGALSQFKLGDGASPEVFTLVGGCKHISKISQKKTLIPITDLQSVAAEFTDSLPEGQEFTITCNYDSANAQQTALQVAGSVTGSGARKNAKVVMSPNLGGKTISFAMIVLGTDLPELGPDALAEFVVTFKISGAVTIT